MPVSADLQHLDETVKSMMEKSHKKFKIRNRQKLGKTCKVCWKEGLATDIMRHIEAHHVEGVEIPCNHCEKIFSSRKKCMITFQNITHSNDVLCRTERSMGRLVFFLFLYQFLARMNLAILVNVVILVILVCNVITMILWGKQFEITLEYLQWQKID